MSFSLFYIVLNKFLFLFEREIFIFFMYMGFEKIFDFFKDIMQNITFLIIF